MWGFQIPLSPRPIQHEFTHRIAAVEKLKAIHCTSLAQLDPLFASLQHRAFRGDCNLEPATHPLDFDGRILQRGFWLYIWETIPPSGPTLHYVGRTGDSSSPNAQSPFNRMGQHLGFNVYSNVLCKYPASTHVLPEQCRFRLVSHGPILEESDHPGTHRERRDVVAALEKSLAEALCASGYQVLNTVSCRVAVDSDRYALVREAFAEHFPALLTRTIFADEVLSQENA